MSRASVANASAQPEARLNFAFFRQIFRVRPRRPRRANPLHQTDLEPLARLGVPVALVASIAILIAISFRFAYAEQDRLVAAATSDIEFITSVIANDIDARQQANPAAKSSEALAQAIPAQALAHGQRILLSDLTGKIVASLPDPSLSGTLADHIGAEQPLTVFAEKAGVMRLSLPSGVEALAMAHTLHAPLGQVTIIRPIEDVLGHWRATLLRTSVLLASVTAVLIALVAAYVWQSTKARTADTSCRAMRNRVDMVLSRGRCGLWDWDLITGEIDWSPSMYEIIGMAPRQDAMNSVEINDLIHPEDGGLTELTRALSSGTATSVDHVFRMRNGAGQWTWLRAKAELVHGKGGVPHLVGIAIDITETMALEERTARADMRLRDAIETISEAFVVWDAENRLVMCNSKFQRFHNLPAQAIATGTPYAMVMEHGTAPLVHSQVPLAEAQPLGARTFEAQLADGRWLQINERRTKDGGYVSVGTDITALKRNESQLIESERCLLHSVADLKKSRQDLETQAQILAEFAEKSREKTQEAESANRAKSDFLANMGHELRTPLNAILGFSEIMMMESFGELGSPLYQEYVRDIHSSGQYLLNVIADVLEMSQLEDRRIRLEKKDFEVAGAVEAAIVAMAAGAESSKVAIKSDVAADTKLFADRTAVEKILTILLNNSVKYTPANGTVTVRTSTAQGALNIYVEDTGIGIPPEAIPRLGKPFEQLAQSLKNGMRGSGLGLAIARSLVELHGGSLRIQSQPDVGTVVMVTLPNPRHAPRSKPQLVASSARSSTRPRRFALQPGDTTAAKVSRTA